MTLHEFYASQRRRQYAIIAFVFVASGFNYVTVNDASDHLRWLLTQLAITAVALIADRFRRRRQPPL